MRYCCSGLFCTWMDASLDLSVALCPALHLTYSSLHHHTGPFYLYDHEQVYYP